MIAACPVCGSTERTDVLSLPSVPVLINAQVRPEQARQVPCGDIDLVVCHDCAHLYNRSFDAGALEYDAAYENSLHFSPAFREFAAALADRLVAEYDLVGASVAELGSGPGHFLAMLCARGVGRADGFDPSYDPKRMGAPEHPAVSIRTDVFPDDGSLAVPFAFSQHVLEHLTDPCAALAALRTAVADADGVVYSEVPNGEYMLVECALWDLIYEHVSYFVTTSFERAHRQVGLEPERSGVEFGRQFLWGTSRPADHAPSPGADPSLGTDASLCADSPSDVERVERVERGVADAIVFGQRARARIDEARADLIRWAESGPVVVWGAGSKGMTYLNLVASSAPVAAVVDINPRKIGCGVPGTDLVVAGPDVVASVSPATILVANPLYRAEIAAAVAERGVTACIETLWG